VACEVRRYRARAEGPIGYEVRDLQVSAGEDIGFSTSLDGSSGTKKNGERSEMWMRTTMCYRKVAGEWRITHEHVSLPFDMQSFKALLDLKPSRLANRNSRERGDIAPRAFVVAMPERRPHRHHLLAGT